MLTTIFSKWAWHGRPPELGQHLAHQDMGQGVLLRTPRQGAHGVRVHPPEVLPHPPHCSALCVDPQGQQVRRLLPREVFEASPKATVSSGSTQCYNFEEGLTKT